MLRFGVKRPPLVFFVLQAVFTATPHSYGKGQNSTIYKIETPEQILTKFCTVDCVLEICPQTKFNDDRISGGVWEIYDVCYFLYFFPEPTCRPDHPTSFHAK